MAGIEPIGSINTFSDTTMLANQSKLDPTSDIASEIGSTLTQLRQNSLANADVVRGGPAQTNAPMQVGPASIAPPAGTETDSTVAPQIEMLESLSAMTWRMVSFEMANATMQKTDKSVKMFVQAQ